MAVMTSPGLRLLSNTPSMNVSTGIRRSPGAAGDNRRAKRRESRNPVRRRIGMDEAAADGAAVAHRAIGDAGGDARASRRW